MVKEKNLLVLFAVVVTIAAGTLPALAATYYVKNSGSDSANGLTDATAWKTIGKVNSQTFSPGDTICFKAGDTWRIPQDAMLQPDSGSAAGGYITYTSYGDGPMPLLLGSVEKNNTSDWTNTGVNIWATANGSFTLDVGNLIFDNEADTGDKKWSSSDLTAQGDYYYDATLDRVLLYSAGNPATYYSDIECAVKKYIIEVANKSYITLEKLDLRYGGAHGIWLRNGSNNIKVRDNDISYVGGSQQSGTLRYGNGIEIWNSGRDIWIERNRIWEIYDVALTNQSDSTAGLYQYNIYYRYNVVWNCAYSYEYFARNSGTDVHNIFIENNTFVNAGDGWSYSADPRGYSLRFWYSGGTANADIIYNFYIRNNVIYQDNIVNTANENLNRCWILPIIIPNLISNYNCWYKAVGGMIDYGGTVYTMAQFSSYQSATGWDGSSIATDPVFADMAGGDYRLRDSSPCIDTALNTGQTEDFDYNPIIPAGSPDMGAFEWTLASDFDHNGAVDFLDYALFGGAWRTTPADSDYDDAYDLVDNDSIDYDDLGNFTNDWLWSAD